MIGVRSASREAVVFALMMWDEKSSPLEKIKNFSWYFDLFNYEKEDETLELISIEERNKAFFLENSSKLFIGVISEVSIIDTQIKKFLINWHFSRLHSIDKAILRLATYELMYCYDISAEIIISEATRMIIDYSNMNSYRYINGILHQIKMEYRTLNASAKPKMLKKRQIKLKKVKK